MRDVLVDYLHGVALASPKNAAKALEAGWSVLMQCIRLHTTPIHGVEAGSL